jgi:hypothetical protein
MARCVMYVKSKNGWKKCPEDESEESSPPTSSSSFLLEDSSAGWHADKWEADDESDTDAEEQVERNLKSAQNHENVSTFYSCRHSALEHFIFLKSFHFFIFYGAHNN